MVTDVTARTGEADCVSAYAGVRRRSRVCLCVYASRRQKLSDRVFFFLSLPLRLA